MPSMGPQLPPHLQKRKRTAAGDATPDSPPGKTKRRTKEGEIGPDDDSSDDGFGPQVNAPTRPSGRSTIELERQAKPASPPRAAIGPGPPPSHLNRDEILLEKDGDLDNDQHITHPARPTAAPRHPSAPAPQRIIGPAAPPSGHPSDPDPDPDPDSDPDSDSDSDYGPQPPTAAQAEHAAAAAARPEPQPRGAPADALPAPAKRDDWMLAPPTPAAAAEARGAPDPTKLRSRRFATGRAAGAAAGAGAGQVSGIWTETPEEKARRLADAVLGRGDAGQEAGSAAGTAAAQHGRAADEERIRSYTEQTRGRSLYEEHQARRKAAKDGGAAAAAVEEEDDPSKRAFSWEKDMKATGTINNSQRRELLNRAANFGDRFQKGRYL